MIQMTIRTSTKVKALFILKLGNVRFSKFAGYILLRDNPHGDATDDALDYILARSPLTIVGDEGSGGTSLRFPQELSKALKH
jgi:hypothetical protein